MYLRDAVNVVIDNARASMRKGLRLVTPVPYTDLWQSTLHGDAFARLGDKWVKVNTSDWSHEVLATVGDGPLSHLVLNGKVLVAAPGGLFEFDGRAAKRLVLDVPPGPMLSVSAGGWWWPWVRCCASRRPWHTTSMTCATTLCRCPSALPSWHPSMAGCG